MRPRIVFLNFTRFGNNILHLIQPAIASQTEGSICI
jgi:hypothetical protein